MLLVIYTTNLYRRKISTFFCPKTKFGLKKRQLLCMRRRQYDVSGLNFNFVCGRPHGDGPPVHMRPPEPDPPSVWMS